MRRAEQLRISGSGRKLRLTGSGAGAPLERLRESAGLARAVDKLQRELVRDARGAGSTWTEIGEALGVSRQAAWERFSAPPD
jgi:hypothetical protein